MKQKRKDYAGVPDMGKDRTDYLLQILGEFSIPRKLVHSFIFLLEFDHGYETGYRDCPWRMSSEGVYCEWLEKDIEELLREGDVVEENGVLKRADRIGDSNVPDPLASVMILHMATMVYYRTPLST